MTSRVLILRPEPGATATLARAQTLGLDALARPLFAVRELDWTPPDPATWDALLLGSANALRHAGALPQSWRGRPAYVVGEATAEAARAAGLAIAGIGSGGLQGVLGDVAPNHTRLLRLAGRERVVLDVPAAIRIETCEVYAAEPLPPPADLAEILARPLVVLLHSGEAAARFCEVCDALSVDRARLSLALIGPRLRQRLRPHLGTGWARLESACEPSDAALLALAVRMCQDIASGSHFQTQKRP
ncbi:uroporphyrinogen-III synthase [Novosphingobium sp. 9]|uniref:uroporphyrinogen-III synthase n=1 Tax=Novosphingobium sp. 9 TaxID=2025349 RepID=UPI0021B5F1D6|nr:uroporphyrinogen-III synthase [Novosphingobium sp. 9]